MVLEINATAEMTFHMYTNQGNPKDLSSKIIDYYFPETIHNDKAHFYFDYNSILEPLRSSSAQSIEVTPPSFGKLLKDRYIINGEGFKQKCLNLIRRIEMNNNIHGSLKIQIKPN